MDAKPGHVFVRGQWEWREGNWKWVAGHWERERAGKKWRDSRWEQRGDHYELVAGDWIDDAAGGTAPTQPTQPRPPRPRRLDRPVVSSYWPTKGQAGSRIVIRGRNFAPDTAVFWGGTAVTGAKVGATAIVFEVPATAATGSIELRAGRGRALPVGTFEIAAAYDATAEAKRLEDERRRKAEAAWADRKKALAKDKAARHAAARERASERAATRERRRVERAEAIRAKWDRAFLSNEEVQAELTLHAQRTADIERMLELAEVQGDDKLAIRIGIARSREDERHEQRMAALRAAFQSP